MINISYARELLKRLQYKDWRFLILEDPFCLQIDLVNGWKSRKWILSIHMTPSELVQTALKAVLTAEEHEAREAFTLDGVACFSPHFDVFKLAVFARAKNIRDLRD